MKKRYIAIILVLIVALAWQMYIFYSNTNNQNILDNRIQIQNQSLQDVANKNTQLTNELDMIRNEQSDLSEEHELWSKRVKQSQDYLK